MSAASFLVAASLLVAVALDSPTAAAPAAAPATGPAPPHFDTEIVPVLTRAGCNAGACHGAAKGRGGFRLSLLGGDAAADYAAIVQEREGRRINLAWPEASLVLAKPTGLLDHGGDVPLDADGAGAKRLVDWIAAGAPRGPPRRLTQFEVNPPAAVVLHAGATLPLRAIARFDNGPAQDVTAWTVITAADPSALAIDASSHRATVLRRGQHTAIARFLDRVVPLSVTLPLADEPVDHASQPRAGFVDDEILATLTTLRLPVSPPADDRAFFRRVWLDLAGRLPPLNELATFLADPASDKRARAIDRLLASDAFVEYWTLRLGRLLRAASLPGDATGVEIYRRWLADQIAGGVSFDEVARQLLTATGDSHRVGPANFVRTATDARDHAELVGHVFLGSRIQCANCHNHPLDRWTQDDYHGLAAVFARLERGRVVTVAARGAVTNLRTAEPAVPRIPGNRDLDPNADNRAAFAAWLTAAENPYFARATVNRLWQALFGRGLVEPADDLRATNPATHPELLDRLAADFVASGFDLRHTLRQLANSETYRRSATALPANAVDDRFYSRAYARPVEPEVAADMIADVTGVADQFAQQPPGTRAVALFDPHAPAPALDVLGRCSRVSSCDGGTAVGGLPAKLHLLNGELVNGKIAAADGRLHRLVDAGASDEAIIAEFYVRALVRGPSEAERKFWQDAAAAAVAQPDEAATRARAQFLEDFVWSLLNSREFRMNR
ncbi:MAG: DUF1549 domain-containing protein [Pirellulales bacterium]